MLHPIGPAAQRRAVRVIAALSTQKQPLKMSCVAVSAMAALSLSVLHGRPIPQRTTTAGMRAPADADVTSVIEALFGTERSRQAFARQDRSMSEARERFSPNRKVELTYGEFDLPFFFALLRDANPQPGELFCDVGSGCGRLVLAAAMMYSWRSAAGIELLRDLHDDALDAHSRLSALVEAEADIQLAPCTFRCGEADDELPSLLQEARVETTHVIFVYATCWPGAGPYLPQLSQTLAHILQHGSRVVTVDKQLVSEPGQWRFEQLAEQQMENYNTVSSVGYVYRFERDDSHASSERHSASSVPAASTPSARHGQVVSRALAERESGGDSRRLANFRGFPQ